VEHDHLDDGDATGEHACTHRRRATHSAGGRPYPSPGGGRSAGPILLPPPARAIDAIAPDVPVASGRAQAARKTCSRRVPHCLLTRIWATRARAGGQMGGNNAPSRADTLSRGGAGVGRHCLYIVAETANIAWYAGSPSPEDAGREIHTARRKQVAAPSVAASCCMKISCFLYGGSTATLACTTFTCAIHSGAATKPLL